MSHIVSAWCGRCETDAWRIGYVSQSPWIQTGTLRENVVLGTRFDEEWYWQVRELDLPAPHILLE